MTVTLSLSDPWDLGEALGWPTLVATVVHRSTEAWLVELAQPFTHSGVEYRFLVVSARHADNTLADSASRRVPCNIVRTTPDRASEADPCDLSWWRGGGSMIGSIAASQATECLDMSCQPPNKQLERTAIRRHVRAACAAFHCAHAARWTRGHAAAQLRR